MTSASQSSTKPQRITRADVFGACDALVKEGERPTNERVRLLLGRGSPNTIHPLIGEWWATIAARLVLPTERPPEIPEAIWAIGSDLWAAALVESRAIAERELAPRVSAANAQMASAENAIIKAAAVAETAELKVTEMRQVKEALQSRLDAATAEIGQLRGELGASRARADTLASEVGDAKAAIESLHSSHAAAIDRMEGARAADRSTWGQERAELIAVTERDGARLMAQLDRAAQSAHDAQKRADGIERGLRAQIDARDTQITEFAHHVRDANARAHHAQAVSIQIAAELSAAETRWREAERELQSLSAQHAADVATRDRMIAERDETIARWRAETLTPDTRGTV